MGICVCKNTCERFAIKIQGKDSYVNNCICRTCSVWLPLECLTKKMRCPCCNQRPRFKRRYTRKKEIKRIV